MKDPSVIQSWLEQVQNGGRGLTKWEEDFIASLSDQVERSIAITGWFRISEKQEEILERIYAEKTR